MSELFVIGIWTPNKEFDAMFCCTRKMIQKDTMTDTTEMIHLFPQLHKFIFFVKQDTYMDTSIQWDHADKCIGTPNKKNDTKDTSKFQKWL